MKDNPLSAIEQIVDAYVRLGNSGALEDLLAHRQKLALGIEGRNLDYSALPGHLENDIKTIVRGLDKLRLDGADTSKPDGTSQAEPPE